MRSILTWFFFVALRSLSCADKTCAIKSININMCFWLFHSSSLWNISNFVCANRSECWTINMIFTTMLSLTPNIITSLIWAHIFLWDMRRGTKKKQRTVAPTEKIREKMWSKWGEITFNKFYRLSNSCTSGSVRSVWRCRNLSHKTIYWI